MRIYAAESFLAAGSRRSSEQKPPQTAQVVEQTAADLEMLFQFIQFELHNLQGLHSSFRFGGRRDIGCDFAFGFRNCFYQ